MKALFDSIRWIARVALSGLWLISLSAHAVDPLEAMSRSLKTLTPGSTLEGPDGTYTTKGVINIVGLQGTAEKPIVIRAQHRGEAVIAGAAGFILRDCAHVVIEGFVFENDADQQCVMLDNCQHVRVTRNTFHPTERARPRHWEHWVTVDGARSAQNRIDHNLFEHKVNRGSPVFIRGDDVALVCSQQDRIDHNHFRDVVFAKGENGHETIRTGGNDLGASGKSSFTTIESNFLEGGSGEDEIISLKSSDNFVRNNTLINCRGAICLRLGNRSEVSGNFIIATEDGPGFGGIKLYGFEHRVFNNYFSGLTGRRHEAPLALGPATLDTPTTDQIGAKYNDATCTAPTRCWIAYNTWVDCKPLEFGFKEEKDRPHLPAQCIFTNNLVVHTRPFMTPLVKVELVRDLRAHGNLGYYGATDPTDDWARWFQFAEPQFRRIPGPPLLLQLTAQSPAIGAATDDNDDRKITEDIFGHPRPARRDIGAEQFSNDPGSRSLLRSQDVGPDAP